MQENPITQLLDRVHGGDRGAESELLDALHDQLRQLASSQMRRERPDHTLQTTALVNEAYMKLVAPGRDAFKDRAHFFAAAAQAMRRILLQHARDRRRLKRGGDRQRVTADERHFQIAGPDLDLIALDQALHKLADFDAPKVKLVELRYFAGLTLQEAAEVLGSSVATLKREWQMAKAWLFRELDGTDEQPQDAS